MNFKKMMTYRVTNSSRIRALLAVACVGLTLLLTSRARALEFLPGITFVPEEFAKAWGMDAKQVNNAFGRNAVISAQTISSSIPASILWPGDNVKFEVQITNLTDQPVKLEGKVIVLHYELYTYPEDMFKVGPRVMGEVDSSAIKIELDAKGWRNVTVEPKIPNTFGGYAMLLEIPGEPRIFLGTCVRSVKPDITPGLHRLTMDNDYIPMLERLGASCNRIHAPSMSSDGSDEAYEPLYQRAANKLRDFHKAKQLLSIEFGTDAQSGSALPMGHARGFPVKMIDGKPNITHYWVGDMVWLPKFDQTFKKNVKRFLKEFGAPNGPVMAIKLFNEPWNGASMSGWGADDLRYRELFTLMVEARDESAIEDGTKVLVGGCDSSSNTYDKLFPDGDMKFLKSLDFLSVHYQGMEPDTGARMFLDRKGPNGPTQVWDTESWTANSDGRISAMLPTYWALGLQRGVGIHSQRVATAVFNINVKTDDGEKSREMFTTWSPAASIGALQHFVGDRPFDRILLKGLPWVYVFDGRKEADGSIRADDGTVVVVGDLSPVFGSSAVLFRDVKSLDEVAAKRELHQKLATMTPFSAERLEAQKEWNTRSLFTNAYIVVDNKDGKFSLFQSQGNPVPSQDGKLLVPINDLGWYLKADGSPGSFQALVTAMQNASVTGLEPADVVVHDMLTPVAGGSVVRLKVRNIANRDIQGTLSLTLGKLELEYPKQLSLAPGEVKTLDVKVTGAADPSNAYALSVVFDAGKDGLALHDEVVRVNQIAKKTITVDGDLAEWRDVLPQTVATDGTLNRTDAEVAWLPGQPFNPTAKKGLATVWLAYDDNGFYVGAKVADSTPDKGLPRFNNWDEDAYFVPETVTLRLDPEKNVPVQELHWPKEVRRFSYARFPDMPSGDGNQDNMQIAFNVLPQEQKPSLAYPKGTMPQFSGYADTDYEFALNPVGEEYGGGTEIWRVRAPHLPNKHYFPRAPKAPGEGPAEGQLIIKREGNTRIVECSIPWKEMPEVKARIDAGQTIKLTFRVSDNAGIGCMELANGRSVSRKNQFRALKPDWVEHWANEIEFSAQK